MFLCAVQLQHLVEVILVGVGGGGAYLQVCVVQVVAARWLRGGARWVCFIKTMVHAGIDPAQVASFRRMERHKPLNHGHFLWYKLK